MSIPFLRKQKRRRRKDVRCRELRLVTWTLAVAAVLWGLSLLALLDATAERRRTTAETPAQSFRETALRNHISQIRLPRSFLPSDAALRYQTSRSRSNDLSFRSLVRAPPRSQQCANATLLSNACLAQRHHCPLRLQQSPLDRDVYTASRRTTTVTTQHHCRTLWFSGFHAGPTSHCSARGMRMEYAAALASAQHFSDDGVLQPVLLLGRLGLSDTDDDATALREWAVEQGAIVVTIDQLSIQDTIAEWHAEDGSIGPQHLMGPYLRMDIPWIIEKYKLFDLPGVCDRHVLYTDSDSLFVNRVQHKDVELLRDILGQRLFSSLTPLWTRFWQNVWASEPPYLLYGREGLLQGRKPKNTGVMLIDVPRFAQELPAIVRFRTQHPDPSLFRAFDQGLLNLYFEQSFRTGLGRHMLPLHWNWKLYWPLDDDEKMLDDVLLVHFHGPKLQQGVQEMADCEMHTLGPATPLQYRGMIERGACCNGGSSASAVLKLFHSLKPSEQDVC